MELLWGNAFYRCLCPNRGKNRGQDIPVRGRENTRPGVALLCYQLKGEVCFYGHNDRFRFQFYEV